MPAFNKLVNDEVDPILLKKLFDKPTKLSDKAWQKITTDIYSFTFGSSEIYNGKTSVYSTGYDYKLDQPITLGNLNEAIPLYPGLAVASAWPKDDKFILSIYIDNGKLDYSRDFSDLISIFVHERHHGLNGHTAETNANERSAYEKQFSHPSWKETTKGFREHMLKNYESYGGDSNKYRF